MTPDTTALLLIEYQNDFVSEGGAQHDAVKAVMADTDMLAQVRSGGIEFFTPSALVIATLVPVAAINAIGFAFSDYAQVWSAMDGRLGAHVRAAIAPDEAVEAVRAYWERTSVEPPVHTPENADAQ